MEIIERTTEFRFLKRWQGSEPQGAFPSIGEYITRLQQKCIVKDNDSTTGQRVAWVDIPVVSE